MNANKIAGVEVEVSAAQAKAGFKAKCVEVEGKLVWTFGNGQTAEIDPDTLTAGIRHAAMMHGLKQTISDAYSGIKTASEAYTFAQVRIDTLVGGEWSSRGKAGEGNNDLVQAVVNISGKTLAECMALIGQLDEAQKKALAKKPQVMAEVARLKAERLAAAVGDDTSLADLFGGAV